MNSSLTRALVVVISLISNAYGAVSSHRKPEKAPALILQTFTKNTETYTQGKIHATRSTSGTYSATTFRRRSLVAIHGADAMRVFNALKNSFEQQPKPIIKPEPYKPKPK